MLAGMEEKQLKPDLLREAPRVDRSLSKCLMPFVMIMLALEPQDYDAIF